MQASPATTESAIAGSLVASGTNGWSVLTGQQGGGSLDWSRQGTNDFVSGLAAFEGSFSLKNHGSHPNLGLVI